MTLTVEEAGTPAEITEMFHRREITRWQYLDTSERLLLHLVIGHMLVRAKPDQRYLAILVVVHDENPDAEEHSIVFTTRALPHG